MMRRHAVEVLGHLVVAPVHLHPVTRATMEHVVAVIQSDGMPIRYGLTMVG
jgi:hypothetical protein